MKTNKIDKDVKQKFENRTFKPSASAWERLSVQLDEQPKQKKIGRFFYIGAAASILLLVTIGIKMFSDDTEEIIPKEEIVISPIDTNLIDKKIEKFINEIPVEEALVNQKEVEFDNKKNTEKVIVKREKYQHKKNNATKKEQTVIAKVDIENKDVISTEIEKSSINKIKILEQDPNSTIKINADDLLYAVTHSPREVKEYYAKYNVNREDVLRTIKNELKKSNIKVNPNTILAEVERTIDDDDFQNNFMKSLKRRVTDIASAIASRND
ncbi:hypothetical protein KO506_10025 [Polaribacter vadi]|uniref:hypothetical protein n=1 Tax=Polaribacter TaxID=52959 RepID=UPI001C08C309|nr:MULTISPECIES: hypothetical protein [Polaribacter]MBU3011740.1 hypothetical protein [Polaribacter vadi]MDO6741553.1 hypothetical protein [Polaribacter sp. 1_MG-2023]